MPNATCAACGTTKLSSYVLLHAGRRKTYTGGLEQGIKLSVGVVRSLAGRVDHGFTEGLQVAYADTRRVSMQRGEGGARANDPASLAGQAYSWEEGSPTLTHPQTT